MFRANIALGVLLAFNSVAALGQCADVGCMSVALKAAELEMSQAYEAALAQGDEKAKEGLRLSQKEWLATRDEEAREAREESGEGGSLGGAIYVHRKLELTKARTLELLDLVQASP